MSHREKDTFESSIYTQSEHTSSRLDFPKLPGQQRMETLPNCFQTNLNSFRKPLLDLFASKLCHQMPRYIVWRLNPQIVGKNGFHQDWKGQILYAFPSFSMIGKVLRKVQKDKTNMVLVTLAWQSQSWYSILSKMTIKNPILLPNQPNVLLRPESKIHPLIHNFSLRLVACLVFPVLSFWFSVKLRICLEIVG